MFKKTINNCALIVMGLSITACSDSFLSTESNTNTLSGTGEKTPLEVSVTLQDSYGNSPQTRALNGTFEDGDVLWALVENVKREGTEGSYTYTSNINSLVSFSANKKAATVTSKDGLTTGIYWDDFSSDSDDKDIRLDNNYLRIGYGFCFNGASIETSSLNASNATINWSVNSNQSSLSDLRKSDLLWAGRQKEIHYNHDSFKPDATDAQKKEVILPVTYTHAMSKVTIELVLDEGYATNNSGIAAAFDNATTPTLYANKTASVDAINQSITATEVSGDDAKIQMYLVQDANSTNPKTRIYEAIIAPTVMKADNVLAEVTVDGNKYELKLTDDLLKTLPENRTGSSWASELYSYTSSDGKGSKNSPEESQASAESPNGITKSGINYYLIAKLKKQKIEVSASIADWEPVFSSTEGLIQFSADVTDPSVSDGSTTVTSTSFDLWMSSTNTDATTYDANTTEEGIQNASTYIYNSTTNKWEGSPVLYWPNGDQKYYFRALAKYSEVGDAKTKTITSVGGSQDAAQGSDLLWAQTSEHTGAGVNYAAGAAINPRTGDVPLTFQHAMSKISVTLKNKYTSSDVPAGVSATDYADPRNPLVDLEGAKISIINLYDKGTIDISTGKMVKTSLDNSSTTEPYTIKDQAVVKKTVDGKDVYQWQDYIVVPQSLIKDNSDAGRETAPSFYSLANLTAIYSSGTSIPAAGDPTYYLTTELEKVVETYTEAEANAYNLALPAPAAVWTTSTIKEPERLYTYEEFSTGKYHLSFTTDQFSTIAPVAKTVEYTLVEFVALTSATITSEIFETIPQQLKLKTAAELYQDGDEIPEGKNVGDVKTEATYYVYSELTEFLTALSNSEEKKTTFNSSHDAWKKKILTEDEYKALDPLPEALFNLLPEALKTRPAVTYNEQEVNEHNATLPGAVHEGDIKTIYHKLKENETTPQSHGIGELIDRGNKIMLYVTLADGTIYSIDLATCKVDSSDVGITEWEGGIHYNYTITLSKEDITFRALVKDWVTANGSGNATLDWD